MKDTLSSALAFAADQAQSHGLGLRVVHSVEPLGDWVRPSASELMGLASEQAILAIAEAALKTRSPSVVADYALVPGPPADALRHEAQNAAMVVVGTDSANWLDRLFGGMVTEHVSSSAACPVAVVPELPGQAASGGVAVAIDARSQVDGPLWFGFDEASRRGGELHVLHVVPTTLVSRDLASVHAAMSEILAGWSEQFPDVVVKPRVVFDRVDEACLRIGRQVGLLILGRQRESFASLLFDHPVLHRIAHEASCPTVVVPNRWSPRREVPHGQPLPRLAATDTAT